ncbi:MAG TPA: tripartite tricarboxylate transporter substrate-binding protein [Xanthobacteraceae bacterium]
MAAIIAAPLLAAPASAQDFPTRTITMVVPFPAGGPSDTVARFMADGMGRHLGRTIIIENVGGAGGIIGATRAAEAPPDGYTLLGASMGTIVAAPSFYPNLKYDPTKDFEPIGMTADAPAAIAAKADFPANNLQEFVAYVRQHGADVKQAHGGIGSSSHMACLLFNKVFDLKPTAVAYRGTGPALNDLMGGYVDYFCEQAVVVAPGVRAGKIKGLVVSANDRLAALPDVPGAQEAGAPDFQLNIWSAIYAPKGTPKDIVAKLAEALDQTLDEPEIAKKLGNLGATVPPKSQRGPDYLRKTLAADIPRWAPILKQAAATTGADGR